MASKSNHLLNLYDAASGEKEYFELKKLAMNGKLPVYYKGRLVSPNNFPWYLKAEARSVKVKEEHLKTARRILKQLQK